MAPEELDLAIEQLLEENPNQEKPVRKRKNKERELKRRLKNGKSIISDKVVLELVGDKVIEEVASVYIGYTKKAIHLGRVNGWYDDIKEIARVCKTDRNLIRLQKEFRNDYASGRNFWTGYANIYQDGYSVKLTFYNTEGKRIASWGHYRDVCILSEIPIEEGLYDYDGDIQEWVKAMYKDAPTKNEINAYKVLRYKWDEDKLLRYDKKGKYRVYDKVLRAYNKCNNRYSGTIRIEKGNEVGTRNQLISAVNEQLKEKKPMGYGLRANLEDFESDFSYELDAIIQDYECDYYDVVNEYIW